MGGWRSAFAPRCSAIVGQSSVHRFTDADTRAPTHQEQVIDGAADHVVVLVIVGAKIALGHRAEVNVRADFDLQPVLPIQVVDSLLQLHRSINGVDGGIIIENGKTPVSCT